MRQALFATEPTPSHEPHPRQDHDEKDKRARASFQTFFTLSRGEPGTTTGDRRRTGQHKTKGVPTETHANHACGRKGCDTSQTGGQALNSRARLSEPLEPPPEEGDEDLGDVLMEILTADESTNIPAGPERMECQ